MHQLLEIHEQYGKFGTILLDPPWQFDNRKGKASPEHVRLKRYKTMPLGEIMQLPISHLGAPKSHLYLWAPNTFLYDALTLMKLWGYIYKTNITWYKIRKDGGPDRRGVGFYFRNVTENLLFGVRGKLRTAAPARRIPNVIVSRKREHSRKPDETYHLIERCSPDPRIELFARTARAGWLQLGDELGKFTDESADESRPAPCVTPTNGAD